MDEGGTGSSDPGAERQYAEALAAFRRGDTAASRRMSEEALATARQGGSERGQALAHIGLSRVDFRAGDYAGGAAHAALADEHARACGADDLRVTALHMNAELTRAQGAYGPAVGLYEELLAMDRARGDEAALAMEHSNLGAVFVQTGDYTAALSHLQRGLDLLAAKPGLLLYLVLGYAGLYARTGQPQRAAQLLGAVESHLARVGDVLDPAEAVEFSGHQRAAEAADADFRSAYEAGRRLTLEQARTLLD